MVDRNFDDLASRFQRNIYGGVKGDIRLAVLKRDFNFYCPQALLPAGNNPLRILDAGGGSGAFSLPLAALGHQLTLCDVSSAMLAIARENMTDQPWADNVKIVHGAIQNFPDSGEKYDLILCHAVLEWVDDPLLILQQLKLLLAPAGYFSLTFYNVHGTVFKNLLRANYCKVIERNYQGAKGSLTPTWPRDPEDVKEWVEQVSLKRLCHSGMRVFHDYILDAGNRDRDPEAVIELELLLSQQSPYRELGRYQHFLLIHSLK